MIRNGNVSHPEINGVRLDLLHVLCVRQGFQTRTRLTALLYFMVSKDIRPQEGSAIARLILRSSGATRMSISMRPDRWFMKTVLSVGNPFAPVDSPPTEEAKQAWQLLCHPAEIQVATKFMGARRPPTVSKWSADVFGSFAALRW